MTKIERNHLTHAQFYQLCEWIKTANLDGVHNRPEAAKRASAGLGFEVSDSSVGKAMEATGIELTPAPASNLARRDRTHILARELVALLRDLGKEPSAELLSITQRHGGVA